MHFEPPLSCVAQNESSHGLVFYFVHLFQSNKEMMEEQIMFGSGLQRDCSHCRPNHVILVALGMHFSSHMFNPRYEQCQRNHAKRTRTFLTHSRKHCQSCSIIASFLRFKCLLRVYACLPSVRQGWFSLKSGCVLRLCGLVFQ